MTVFDKLLIVIKRTCKFVFLPWQYPHAACIDDTFFYLFLCFISSFILILILSKLNKITMVQCKNITLLHFTLLFSIIISISFYWYIAIILNFILMWLLIIYFKKYNSINIDDEEMGVTGCTEEEKAKQQEMYARGGITGYSKENLINQRKEFYQKSELEQKMIRVRNKPNNTLFYYPNLKLHILIVALLIISLILIISFGFNNPYKFFP